MAENGPNNVNRYGIIAETLRNGADLARRHPLRATLGVLPVIIVIGAVILNNQYLQPIRMEEARVQGLARATATAIATENLMRDYSETGGVDLLRRQESYHVSPRGSARLAKDKSELLDNAWVRIKRESNCQPTETLVLPETAGEYPWSRTRPETYVVRVAC